MKISLITFSYLLLLATPASAWQADPVDQEAPAEQAEAPAGPDLTEVNDLIRSGDYADAEAKLAEIQDEFPEDAAILLQRGELLVALGRFPDAVEHLSKSAEIDGERARTRFQLGTALAQTGRREPALAAFAAARDLAADDPDIRTLASLNRGLLLRELDRPAEAIGEFEAVLAAAPERTDLYGDIASLHLETGGLAEAEATLARAEEAGWVSAQHYYSLGARLYRAEEYDRASVALARCIEADPDLAPARKAYAATLEQLGRNEESREQLRRYLELAPDAPDAGAIAERLDG